MMAVHVLFIVEKCVSSTVDKYSAANKSVQRQRTQVTKELKGLKYVIQLHQLLFNQKKHIQNKCILQHSFSLDSG